MAEEDIKINVTVDGAQQAASGVDQVKTALVEEGHAATAAAAGTTATGRSFAELTQAGQNVTARIHGAASAVQGLVGQLGSENRTAGLIGSVAGSVAQFAALGSMLGPAGTVGGAVIGFAASIYGLVTAHNEAADAAVDQAVEIDALAQSYVGLGTATREWMELAGTVTAISSGVGLGEMTGANLATELRERGDRLIEVLIEARETGALVRSEEEVSLRSEITNLESEIARREAERDRPARGGARARTATATAEEPVDDGAFLESMGVETEAEGMRRAEAERERLAELNELRADYAQEDMEREREKTDYLIEMHEDALEREREGQDAARAYNEEREAEEMDRREAELSDLTSIVGRSSKMLTGALVAVASGAESGEDAFKGLLASFLEMISEYTALKAATEFADAIASFASQDYGGGALHLAAGVAFTAVAVATGVGAAVLSAAPQAPARPEPARQEAGSGGSVTNVINWNSPVVTAGTRAELGREMEGLLSEAAAA